MELYTLISLLIGIFGGTYAALNALRSNFESEIKEADKKCDEKVDAIKLIRKDNNSIIRNCETHRDSIHKAHKIWCWANLLPALFFCILISVIAIWVVWDWDSVTAQHTSTDLAAIKSQSPWCFFRGSIVTLLIFNAISIGFADYARRLCTRAHATLSEHHDGLPAPSGITRIQPTVTTVDILPQGQ